MKDKYVTKKEILNEFKIYWNTGEITDKLINFLYLIARKTANSRNYYSYPYKIEMIQEAVIHAILKGIPKFNKNRDNPFAYFSVVISNKYVEFIKREKRNIIVKEQMKRDILNEIGKGDNNIMEKCRDNNTGIDYIRKNEFESENKFWESLRLGYEIEKKKIRLSKNNYITIIRVVLNNLSENSKFYEEKKEEDKEIINNE